MWLRRNLSRVVLCLALMAPIVGCNVGSGGSSEQIRLLITPVPTPTNTPLPLPTVGASKYTVQSGDTLSGIASRFGVTVDAIVRVNNIADPNSLSLGQVLNIPAREVAPPPTIPPVGTAGIPVNPQTPVITGTLTIGPSPTETLPPADATPPQGPALPDATSDTSSTPGITNSPTPGP